MTNKPVHVTFTGVDNWTSVSDMLALSARYPIEWGVLIGGKLEKGRYPELQKVEEVSAAAIANSDLKCALHLCGIFAREADEGRVTSDINTGGYARFQVNAITYNFPVLSKLAEDMNKDIIYQHRKGPFRLELLPPRIFALHDESGGKGKVATVRPDPVPNKLVGYAGGIGPDNVADVLANIKPGLFWIDMETSLRTDDRFDLNKCEAVCKAIWG